MAGIVIDPSLAASWCFPDERTVQTNAVLQAIGDGMEVSAPALWAYEVRNSVLVGVRRGRLDWTDAEAFLSSVKDLGITLKDPVSYDALVGLAREYGLTVYDAAYLDLAIHESRPLATLDKRLMDAARKADVELFPPALK